MVDEVDKTEERIEFDTGIEVKNVCAKAEKFKPGQPGECELCGEEFNRVVEVEKDNQTILACGGCRDKHGIP